METIKTAETIPQVPPNSAFHLASTNTSLALQRTRMAADRTLMAVIRTALSLISFGFTIFKVAESLIAGKFLKASEDSIPHYGITLVLLGIIVLAIGIAYHIQFMLGLRATRHELIGETLIKNKDRFPVSFVLVTAILLMLLGIGEVLSMTFGIGPFS